MTQPVSSKTLVVLVGPTAVGKTDLAVALALRYQCDILSADSRQCYRELGIATAKPAVELQQTVRHHFIDSHSITNPVSVAEYENYALQLLGNIFAKGNFCVMAGGSGLYVKAITEGLDQIPEVPGQVRDDLEKRLKNEGLASLVHELGEVDADILPVIDLQNPRRVIRALEVSLSTGKPYSDFLTHTSKSRPFRTIKIGLQREREELYQRINYRMDQMIANGLFEEAAALYPYRHQKPLQTVGYQEIFGFLEGLYDRNETVRLLKRNSRRYAKRQITWFGKDDSIRWFHADDQQGIMSYLDRIAPVNS